MDIRLNHQPQHLVVDQALSLRLRRPGWVRVTQGQAWLTRDAPRGFAKPGDASSQDLILTPGPWVWLERGAHWVVEPWGHQTGLVTLQWHAMPSMRLFSAAAQTGLREIAHTLRPGQPSPCGVLHCDLNP